MSLDRAIASGKERRKPYRGSARFDGHCRNHNPARMQCGWCRGNRTFSNRRRTTPITEDPMA